MSFGKMDCKIKKKECKKNSLPTRVTANKKFFNRSLIIIFLIFIYNSFVLK